MKKNKKNIIGLVIVSLLFTGFISRLVYYSFYPVQWRDAYTYQTIIEEWNKTRHYPTVQDDGELNYIPPFPLFIFKKLPVLFSNSYFVNGVAFEIVIGCLLLYFIWEICFILRLGIVSSTLISLIACFHHTLLDYSTQVTRDNLYLFFATVSLFSILKLSIKRGFIHSISVGLFIALSFLCRFEAIELLLIFLFFAWRTYRYKTNFFASCVIVFSTFFSVSVLTVYTICPEYNQFLNLFQKALRSFINA